MKKPGPQHKLVAHYISGTHWDREWYRPLQEFRFLLVKLMDELLDLMETNEDFRYFQLDGQTCVLDDYLEFRPENRTRLECLMKAGRLSVGPWFTMPDLFCVGDEALVRNLLLGRRISREWGVEAMPVGFICDMFGHPSQMPQIFAGFDVHNVVLGRGTNEHTTPAFFHWEAPDGSQSFTFKLQDAEGYGAFAKPRAALEGPTVFSASMGGLNADLAAAGPDPKKQRAVREKWFRLEMAHYVKHEIERSNGPTICLMDSMDHSLPAADVALYLRLIREACPEVEPRHSTLPMFFEEARRTARRVPIKRGELREPSRNRCGYLWLIPNCVSARVRLKQANDVCQVLLEKWVEPLLALQAFEPTATNAGLYRVCLRSAWRDVLTNHAHDSICGCSIDQVHRDMMSRYDQARILGEQIRSQVIGDLTSGSVDLAKAPDEFTLTLVNPHPYAEDGVVVFDVDLPTDYPASFVEGLNGQRIKAFVLEDAAGNPVRYQHLGFIPVTNERSRYARFCFMSDGEFSRHTIAARIKLPALGFTSLRVKPSTVPVRTTGTLRTGPASAENEYLVLAIQPNGALTLTDKATGETYTDLLTFEDRSEVGDGWIHSHSINDEQFLSTACSARLSVVDDGPELVTFRMAITMRVPRRYEAREERPSCEYIDLEIHNRLTLRRGAKTVDVETTVTNEAEDHRLKLLLPTDVAAQTYLAHHPYDFVERPVRLDPETANWQEMEQSEKPFLGLQAIGSGRRGLALISGVGLHEGGVMDDARRTMQVTLLRSFRKTVSTGGETEGLERGQIVFRYALFPFAGKLPREAALRELARLQAGVFTRQTGSRPSGFPPMSGDAPSTRSFVECQSGQIIVSAIKPAEDGCGLVMRFWNPSDTAGSETVSFWKAVLTAEAVQLSEDAAPNAPRPKVQGCKVTVTAGPRKIVTIKIQLAEDLAKSSTLQSPRHTRKRK